MASVLGSGPVSGTTWWVCRAERPPWTPELYTRPVAVGPAKRDVVAASLPKSDPHVHHRLFRNPDEEVGAVFSAPRQRRRSGPSQNRIPLLGRHRGHVPAAQVDNLQMISTCDTTVQLCETQTAQPETIELFRSEFAVFIGAFAGHFSGPDRGCEVRPLSITAGNPSTGRWRDSLEVSDGRRRTPRASIE